MGIWIGLSTKEVEGECCQQNLEGMWAKQPISEGLLGIPCAEVYQGDCVRQIRLQRPGGCNWEARALIRTRQSRVSPRIGGNNKEEIKGVMSEVESMGIGSHWRAAHIIYNILQSTGAW